MSDHPGQMSLFGPQTTGREAYAEAERPVRLNSTVCKEDAPRLRASLQRLLDRLMEGPATGPELIGIAGHRFGGRIGELREAGYAIPDPERVKGGEFLYYLLKHKAEAERILGRSIGEAAGS